MNATGPSAPRRGAESISSRPSKLEPEQRLGEVRDLEADVVEPLALAREEAGDAGRVVGRLDELDLRLADGQEGDPDAVLGDVHDRLELEAEEVAPEAEGVLDRADDQGDVMDLAEPADPGRDAGGAGRHGVSFIVVASVHEDEQRSPAGAGSPVGHVREDALDGRPIARRQPIRIMPDDDDRPIVGRVRGPEELLEGVPVPAEPGRESEARRELVEELGLRAGAGERRDPAERRIRGRLGAGAPALAQAPGRAGREITRRHGPIRENEA